MLSQIYFLVSGDKPVDVSTLSHIFAYEVCKFYGTHTLQLIDVLSHLISHQGNVCQSQSL